MSELPAVNNKETSFGVLNLGILDIFLIPNVSACNYGGPLQRDISVGLPLLPKNHSGKTTSSFVEKEGEK